MEGIDFPSLKSINLQGKAGVTSIFYLGKLLNSVLGNSPLRMIRIWNILEKQKEETVLNFIKELAVQHPQLAEFYFYTESQPISTDTKKMQQLALLFSQMKGLLYLIFGLSKISLNSERLNKFSASLYKRNKGVRQILLQDSQQNYFWQTPQTESRISAKRDGAVLSVLFGDSYIA